MLPGLQHGGTGSNQEAVRPALAERRSEIGRARGGGQRGSPDLDPQPRPGTPARAGTGAANTGGNNYTDQKGAPPRHQSGRLHYSAEGERFRVNADCCAPAVARRTVPAGRRAVLCHPARTGAGTGGAFLVPRAGRALLLPRSPTAGRSSGRRYRLGRADQTVRSCRVLARPHPGATVTTANRRAPDRQRQRDDHGAAVTTSPPICRFFVVIVNGAYVFRFGGGQHACLSAAERGGEVGLGAHRRAGPRTPAPGHAGHEVLSASQSDASRSTVYPTSCSCQATQSAQAVSRPA